MTRAELKHRNRRALLDAARQIVARDGYLARLDEIAELADLTTGAIYSLFGSKNGLLVALVSDHIGPQYDEIEQAAATGPDLADAVDAFARSHWKLCTDPDAQWRLSLQISLLDMAVRDANLRAQLAGAIRTGEQRLTAVFAGRPHHGDIVTPRQAQRLATALRALFVGLGQGIVLGRVTTADERYFLATARALATPEVLGPL